MGHVPPRDGNNIRQNCTDLCTRRQTKTIHETNSVEQECRARVKGDRRAVMGDEMRQVHVQLVSHMYALQTYF